MRPSTRFVLAVSAVCLLAACSFVAANEDEGSNTQKKEPAKKKKSIADMSDADVEKIYEEWEKDEEPLPDDELPSHLRKTQPGLNIRMDDLKGMNPRDIKLLQKKGKPLMLMVSVSGDPTEAETESITKLWQSSLFNANYEFSRYVIDAKQVIFMVQDGAHAIPIKDFLVKQERCLEVTIDGDNFPGAGKKNTKPAKSDL